MAANFATVAEVRAVAPEFGPDDATGPIRDAAISTWLAIAQPLIGLRRWGEQASAGHALLTAHMVSIAPSPGGSGIDGAGPVVSEAVGPISRSFGFAAGPASDAALATTTHGRIYLTLRQNVLATGSGIVGSSSIRQG